MEEVGVISFCGVGTWCQVIDIACCCNFILRDDWDCLGWLLGGGNLVDDAEEAFGRGKGCLLAGVSYLLLKFFVA